MEEMTEWGEGYNKGYRDGYKDAMIDANSGISDLQTGLERAREVVERMGELSYENVFQTKEQARVFDALIDALGRENVSTYTWKLVGRPDDLHLESVCFLYRKELPSRFIFVSYEPLNYLRETSFFVSAYGSKEYFQMSNPFEAAAKVKEIDANFKKEVQK